MFWVSIPLALIGILNVVDSGILCVIMHVDLLWAILVPQAILVVALNQRSSLQLAIVNCTNCSLNFEIKAKI